MLEFLFDKLTFNLKERNFKQLPLPNIFQEHHNKNSQYIIKNWLFKSSLYRKWRITKLDGGTNLQVFNTVAYPVFESEKPILGADILWFGKTQKLLAVFDFQPLIQDRAYLEQYCSGLHSIKKKYSTFDNQKMKNIYDANQYFSPWVIICRGNKFNLENDLLNVFILFLEEYFKLDNKHFVDKFLSSTEVQKKQIDYDLYSAEKDPADKLFKTFFEISGQRIL